MRETTNIINKEDIVIIKTGVNECIHSTNIFNCQLNYKHWFAEQADIVYHETQWITKEIYVKQTFNYTWNNNSIG